MKLSAIIQKFEKQIPLALQEPWDHCGLQLGDPSAEINSILFAYDVCKETIQTAKKNKCQLIVSHHPFRSRGDANVRLDTYEGKLIEACIKNGISLYTSHTNHDNSDMSANVRILRELGLSNIRPLQPSLIKLYKLIVFVPQKHREEVLTALFNAGAGTIGNYDKCSFSAAGTGTFRGNESTHPTIGKKGERTLAEEERIEVIVKEPDLKHVITQMIKAHPYEEVAYDIYPLENKMTSQGVGALGDFERPVKKEKLLAQLKDIFKISSIRFVDSPKDSFKKIALCTGSGTQYLDAVIAQKADLFVTGDVKYHQAIHAKRHDLALADVGHFSSEQISVEILKDVFQTCCGKRLNYFVFKGLQDPFEMI